MVFKTLAGCFHGIGGNDTRTSSRDIFAHDKPGNRRHTATPMAVSAFASGDIGGPPSTGDQGVLGAFGLKARGQPSFHGAEHPSNAPMAAKTGNPRCIDSERLGTAYRISKLFRISPASSSDTLVSVIV